jgi:hypothetical protein
MKSANEAKHGGRTAGVRQGNLIPEKRKASVGKLGLRRARGGIHSDEIMMRYEKY